jgi:hypothetical protein
MFSGCAYRPARHGRRGASRKTGGGGGPAGASIGAAGMPAGAIMGGAGMPEGSGKAAGAGASWLGVAAGPAGAAGITGAAMLGAGMAMPAKAGAKAGGGGPKRGTAPGRAPSGSRLASRCWTRPLARASRAAISGISGRGGTVPRLGKGALALGGAGRPSFAGPQARSQNFATAWPGSVWQPGNIKASSTQNRA